MSKNENDVDLVSIIMPAYNSGKYIKESINSVINQTYENWELLIIDDCSQDDTKRIIESYSMSNSKIQFLKLSENSGAAVARNLGVKKASGKYIAFLDSDDLWYEKKLEKQVKFMKKNNYYFTCTAYSKIDESSQLLNQIVVPKQISAYDDLLKNNAGNSTVMYDCSKIGKTFIPDIKKRNDYVMWLSVIKKNKYLYGITEVLSSHRVREGSLSGNKLSLVKYHWIVYRKIEELSLIKSLKLIIYWITKGILK